MSRSPSLTSSTVDTPVDSTLDTTLETTLDNNTAISYYFRPHLAEAWSFRFFKLVLKELRPSISDGDSVTYWSIQLSRIIAGSRRGKAAHDHAWRLFFSRELRQARAELAARQAQVVRPARRQRRPTINQCFKTNRNPSVDPPRPDGADKPPEEAGDDIEVKDKPLEGNVEDEELESIFESLDYLFPSKTSLQSYICSGLQGKIISAPTYIYLTQNVIFPGSLESSRLYSPTDMQYLKSKMPDPFIPPQAFMDFCKLCSDFVVTEGEFPLPARGKCPKDMYKYIHQAVSSLLNYDVAALRSTTHGETYDVVHIWGPILDKAFLQSSTLTLNRSELRSIVDTEKRFDGIVSSCPPSSRLDVGFVEHKSWNKSAEADRSKLIDVLVKALQSIEQTVTDMAKIAVHGICCQGLEITVIRACYVDNCIYVCDERKREFTSDLKNDPDTFYRLLEFFWALKMSCESSHDLIRRNRSGFE